MNKDDSNNSRSQHRPFWEKTCEKLHQRLTAKALWLANGRSYDAEDLVQETVLRALTYLRNPNDITNALGYLLSIMRNIWITRWHKEGTANTVSLDELLSNEAQQNQRRSVEPAVEPDVLQFLENNERKAEMRAKQGKLTPREKLLLKLYLECYNCKEIADKLHEDVRLVRSDLNAVRTKVRSRLIKAKALKLP